MISLNTLLAHAHLPSVFPDREIRGIALDSRKVQKGDLFAALAGTQTDGSRFIHQAIEKGASVVMLPEKTELKSMGACIPVYCQNPRLALAIITAAFYKPLPHHQVAITGTNGKTSSADFCRQLWNLQHLNSASIGTLGVLNNVNYNYQGPVLTTPDTITLHEILQTLALHHVDHVAMEASSHGLAQYRLDGVRLQAAGFTNLTRDHLDYHHDLESYFKAKQRLFGEILPKGQIAAFNADMNPIFLKTLYETAQQRKQQIRLVGEKGFFLRLISVTPSPQGQTVTVRTETNTEFSVTLPLLGRYQIDNILLSMALIAKNTHELAEFMPLLPSLKGVKGRMEQAAVLPNKAAVYVDYAHTPDALSHLLQSLRPHTHHQLYVIFGAGGNRDKGKRPLMAQEAGKYADHVIITDDNPRFENPAAIRKEIKTGFPDAIEIAGRETAISQTLKKLQQGDILVVAGKGHEQGQIIGEVTHPFDDIQIIQKHAGMS